MMHESAMQPVSQRQPWGLMGIMAAAATVGLGVVWSAALVSGHVPAMTGWNWALVAGPWAATVVAVWLHVRRTTRAADTPRPDTAPPLAQVQRNVSELLSRLSTSY